MASNPKVLVLSNPTLNSLTNKFDDKKGKIFLVNVFGRSARSQSLKTPLPIYRALMVNSDSENVTDTNKLMVSVIILDTTAADGKQQFSQMVSKVNASFSVIEPHIVSLNERYFYEEKLYVAPFEYVDLGSMYNIMIEGYGGGFEEKHVVCVLKSVFLGLQELKRVQKNHGSLCLSHVYLNSHVLGLCP